MINNFSNSTAAYEEAEASRARGCDRGVCTYIVLGFLGALLMFTLGLIVGAIFATSILAWLPAIIVLAIVLAVLILTILIFNWCMAERRCRGRCGR